MALIDDVQDRTPEQRLIELTNPRVPAPTTVNTTLLALAVSDVSAKFELYSATEYSSSNSTHVAIAVPAVMGKLYEYDGRISENYNEQLELFIANCELLKKGNMPGPVTTSGIVRETEDSSVTQRRENKKSHYDDFRPS
ncbi:MAG: hypothetical protein KDD43_08860 [Bdellovibrionales bacterium]|nr:hypothetical protein [Bdellovibrionales bacterium]